MPAVTRHVGRRRNTSFTQRTGRSPNETVTATIRILPPADVGPLRCTVFFSHSSKDREWVQLVAEQAEAIGVHVYLAEHDVSPGVNLGEKVIAQIRAADAFLVLLTASSRSSPLVQQEIGIASQAEKFIIPLVTPAVLSADLGVLQGKEYIVIDFENPHEALVKLSATLSDLLDRQRASAHAEAARRRQENLVLGGLVILVALLIVTESGRP